MRIKQRNRVSKTMSGLVDEALKVIGDLGKLGSSCQASLPLCECYGRRYKQGRDGQTGRPKLQCQCEAIMEVFARAPKKATQAEATVAVFSYQKDAFHVVKRMQGT